MARRGSDYPGMSSKSRRDDDQSKSFSSSIERLSSSLVSNSDSLGRNSTSLNTNTSSLDKNTSALLKISTMFKSAVGDLSDDLDDFTSETRKVFEAQSRSDSNFLSDMTHLQTRSSNNINQALTRGQKIGNVLLTSFEVIGRRLITELDRSIERVADSYKQNFSDITVKMQWSQSDYSSMFNQMAQTFLQQGLGRQFSPTDYATALGEVLSTGLRGDEAQRQAYQNLITNKLVPAISTNTREYRLMSKQFGGTFTEGITAISKYAEKTYGAEGLDEGQINNIIGAVSASMRLQGTRSGLSEEEIQDQINQLTYGINAMAEAGVNPDHFVSTLKSTLEGTEINLAFAAAGGATADQLISQLNSDPMKFIENYMEIIAQQGIGQTGQNYVSEALGVDTTTGIEILNAVEGNKINWDQVREDYNNFDQSAEYDKWTQALQDGFGKTADSQLDTLEENLTTPVGVFEAELPRFRDLFSDVKTIALTAGAMLFLMKTRSGSVAGTTGSSLFSRVGTSIKGSSLGTGLRGIKSFFSTPVGGSGATIGSTALGISGIAAGLIMGGLDAGGAASSALDRGYGVPTAVGQGVRGFFTGGRMMTSEEDASAIESAMSGQRQSFDWRSLLKNVAKHTATGVGVGALVGGGVGSVPAAVVGGITGVVTGTVTNAIDQIIENGKYNELADAVTEFSSAISESSDAVSNYSKVVSKADSTQTSLDKITGKVYASESERLSILESLKKEYPALLTNVTDLSDFDQEYVDIIKDKIALEKEIAATDAISSVGESIDALKKRIDESGDLFGENVIGKAVYDFAKEVGSEDYAGENGKGKVDDLVKKYAEIAGVSEDQFVEMANQATNGKLIVKNDTGLDWWNNKTEKGYYVAGSVGSIYATAGDNIDQFLNSYDESGVKIGYDKTQAESNLNSINSSLLEVLSQVESLYQNAVDEEGNLVLNDNQKSLVSRYASQIKELVDEYNPLASSLYGSGSTLHSSNEKFDTLRKIVEASGSTLPNFKIGAYDIPSDDTLASLHAGEMVLTSANADKLRQLDSGGISGILSALVSLTSAQVTSVPQESNITSLSSSIVSAIESQTEAIVSQIKSLNQTVLSLISSRSPGNLTEVTEAALTYEGR